MIECFYAWKKEFFIFKVLNQKKNHLTVELEKLKQPKSPCLSPNFRRESRVSMNSRELKPLEEKKLENTPKKTNESVLHESKQNLNLSELNDEEINLDRIETSRNSLSLAGNILKKRVATCGDAEKENKETGVRFKSKSFFKNRRYKNTEKNDSFNFPQPLKTDKIH